MKYIKVFESHNIEKTLKKYSIENYNINEDGTIDVDGDVILAWMDFTELPFKFGRVNGSFDISYNKLRSLNGCPHYIGGDFNCHANKLTNLIGGPDDVDKDYNCCSNKINTLEGLAPNIGGDLWCVSNELEKLESSSSIEKNIYCYENKLDPKNLDFKGWCGGKIYYTQGYGIVHQ